MSPPALSSSSRRPVEFPRTDEPDFARLVSNPQDNADDLLCLAPHTSKRIWFEIERVRVRPIVYERWGLRSVFPYPRTTLNFAGPSGTGKTLAAHYVAKKLGKPLLAASYADIVSKYIGQTARNLHALFRFAAQEDVVVLIDEAEAFLSQRIEDISDGTDHTINSMRNQLLTELEKTPITSIVASNLAHTYDKAFQARVSTIHFPLPDQKVQERIWRAHLPKSVPLAPNITPTRLAQEFRRLDGRQIASVVDKAATWAVIENQPAVRMQDFKLAVGAVTTTLDQRKPKPAKSARINLARPKPNALSSPLLRGEDSENE